MRCSVRESDYLRPAMFTSTPIAKCKRSLGFTFVENSPIPKSHFNQHTIPEQLAKYHNHPRHPISIYKIQGKKKIPINSREKESLRKPLQSYPTMVVISDSEEEDNVYKEITSLQKMLNPSTRMSVSKDSKMNTQKEEKVRQVKNKNVVKPLKEDAFESESKTSLRRVSRVAVIIDEIMKERKSMIAASPVVKQEIKIENNDDAVFSGVRKNDLRKRVPRLSVLTTLESNGNRRNLRRNTYTPNILAEEGTTATKRTKVNNEKLNNVENKEKKTTIKRTRRRTKTIISANEEKENIILSKNDNKTDGAVDKVKTPLKITNYTPKAEENENMPVAHIPLSANQQNTELNVVSSTCTRGEPFNEKLPVFYTHCEVEDNEWIPVSNQKGVFVKKTFHLSNISNGYVKIESKCSFILYSRKSQIFHVAEGRGVFSHGDEKVKLVPGHTITIPSGFHCQILNTGLKKNLIISFTKVDEE